MTPDALPEGLVERCVDASYYPEHPEWKCDDPIIRAEWRKLVVSVLAVAAPQIREQALREAEGAAKRFPRDERYTREEIAMWLGQRAEQKP